MKKRLLLYLIPLLSTSLFVILQVGIIERVVDLSLITEITEQLESKTYDLRLRLRNLVKEQPRTNDIVIVAIDEKSIKEIGRWPWGRDAMAELVNKLSHAGPKVIGIDILFTERERAETDQQLAEALKKAGNVVLATAFIVPVGKKVCSCSQRRSRFPLGFCVHGSEKPERDQVEGFFNKA